MRLVNHLLSATLFVASSFALAQAPDASTPISQAATDYLNRALDLIQENALHRGEVDWTAIRKGAFLHVLGAQTSVDTYPGIYFAFTQLREHHSFLLLPRNLSAADKSRSRAAMNAILGPMEQQAQTPPSSPFVHRTEPEGHLLHSSKHTFAWVSVPLCGIRHSKWEDNFPDFRDYATKLHNVAADLEALHPAGWIIDLRGNGGGNMWPMLSGIGFVLGEGVAGAFVSSDDTVQSEWSYKNGQMLVDGKDANGFKVGPPVTLPTLPPVAVLIDSQTASSGEAVAISFEGRPHTRFFGTHTFGLSTSNSMLSLSDGASLFICSNIEADRKHRRYDDGVQPDVSFPEPSSLPDEYADPVLQAAVAWLSSQ